MTQQVINVGSAPNDGQGDPIRTAFDKCNENFAELYSGSGGANAISNGNSVVDINTFNGNISMSVDSSSNVAVISTAGISTTAIIATGNIRGNYILGNGSQLTGITANYGNANVVALMSNFGSNSISTTGNITTGALRVNNGTFRLPSYTTSQLASIVGVPGDLVYNTTVNKVQAWQYDATNTFTWVSLAVSTYQ